MRKHDLTNKKRKYKYKDKYKDNYKDKNKDNDNDTYIKRTPSKSNPKDF